MHPTPSERWGIVGGGLLGMTLAHRLRQRGVDVTLFEAADHLGGLASAWEVGGVLWDRHYHVTLLSDSRLRHLLAELDLEREMDWVETKTGFYTESRHYSMSNMMEFLRFPPLGLLDKLRLGATIFCASKIKNWKRLEKIPVTDWLRRWSGEHTLQKIWLPLLRAKLGANYTRASAAFIWAIIARMYAARRTGLKKEMFGYVPGGYARILDRFAAKLTDEGAAIHPRHKAMRVTPARQSGVNVEFSNGRQYTLDRVVLTMAAPLAARVCPMLTPEETARLATVAYQGIVCASVLLKKPLTPYYVTNITEPCMPFTAVIDMSALVKHVHLGGHGLVYLPKYLEPADPFFEQSDFEVQATFLQALARMYPQFDRREVEAFRVSRVRHVLAISTLNYSKQVPAMTTSIPGIYVVNSSQIVNGTLNANETIQLAERAAERLLALPPTSRQIAYRQAS
jgi:protoporphyrinogen oxidase